VELLQTAWRRSRITGTVDNTKAILLNSAQFSAYLLRLLHAINWELSVTFLVRCRIEIQSSVLQCFSVILKLRPKGFKVVNRKKLMLHSSGSCFKYHVAYTFCCVF
jgi:hypothetical protein